MAAKELTNIDYINDLKGIFPVVLVGRYEEETMTQSQKQRLEEWRRLPCKIRNDARVGAKGDLRYGDYFLSSEFVIGEIK